MIESIKKIIKNNIYMVSYIYRICPNHIFISFFVSILGSLSGVINIFITRYIINTLQIRNSDNLFIKVMIMAFFLFSINVVYAFLKNYIQLNVIHKSSQIICEKMQTELFIKASEIKMENYDNPDFLNTFSIVLQQFDERAQYVLDNIITFVSGLFSFGALFTLIIALEPVLLVLVIANVIMSFYINTIIAKIQHNFFQEKIQPQREMEYSKYIFYRFENTKEIRLNQNLKNILISNFVSASKKIINLIDSYEKKVVIYSWMQSIVNNITVSLSLIYLAFKVIKSKILIGDFVTLSSSSQQLAVQIYQLIDFFPQMYEHSLYIDNFKQFIECKPPINYDKGLQIKNVKNIKFDNVSFSYPFNNDIILEDINFEINIGEKIAIVGENGAGKSSLVKLLTGLYETSKGNIFINNSNIKECELNSYRRCIGVAFQDYKIYAMSIAENILMRKTDGNEEDINLVIEALKFVDLYDKVMNLPDGINTKLTKEFSDDGAVFSGGEIQKITLARVYASNCSLFILDEPSSSLDPMAEYEIYRKFMSLSKNKCMIIISHQLKNIKNVDHIYVLSNGRIVEDGTHDTLIKKEGLYFEMYNKQILKNISINNLT